MEQRWEVGAEEQSGMRSTGLCGMTVSGSVGARGGADEPTRPPRPRDTPAFGSDGAEGRGLGELHMVQVWGIIVPSSGGGVGSAEADWSSVVLCDVTLPSLRGRSSCQHGESRAARSRMRRRRRELRQGRTQYRRPGPDREHGAQQRRPGRAARDSGCRGSHSRITTRHDDRGSGRCLGGPPDRAG